MGLNVLRLKRALEPRPSKPRCSQPLSCRKKEGKPIAVFLINVLAVAVFWAEPSAVGGSGVPRTCWKCLGPYRGRAALKACDQADGNSAAWQQPWAWYLVVFTAENISL